MKTKLFPLLSFIVLFSCRKITNDRGNSADDQIKSTITVVFNYLNTIQATTTTRNAKRIEKLKEKVIKNTAQVTQYANKTYFVIDIDKNDDAIESDLNLNDDNFLPKKELKYDLSIKKFQNHISKLVLISDQQSIISGSIIEVHSDNSTNYIDQNLASILGGDLKSDFHGLIKFKSLFGKFNISFGFKNGIVESISNIRNRESTNSTIKSNSKAVNFNNSNVIRPNTYCEGGYDQFLVTTYITASGYQYEEWEYLRTVCPIDCGLIDTQTSRIVADCQTYGGGEIPIRTTTPKDPCEMIKNLLSINGFVLHMNTLKDGMASGNSNEKLSYAVKNSLGYNELKMIEGTGGCSGGPDLASQLSSNTKLLNTFHNHLADCNHEAVFTFNDLQALASLFKANKIDDKRKYTFGVMTPQGVFSALMISNDSLFSSFADNLINPVTAGLLVTTFNQLGFRNSNTASEHENKFVRFLAAVNSGLTLYSGSLSDPTFSKWSKKERNPDDLTIKITGCDFN